MLLMSGQVAYYLFVAVTLGTMEIGHAKKSEDVGPSSILQSDHAPVLV
jgi:hypothetical protein